MSATLHIARGLELPIEAATRRLAILAMSGAGKSNTAVAMAEEMFDAGIPWVAIDPKGDWWGVRSNASGKGAGLPIPIFGGLHGDVPLEPSSGKFIANLIVDQRLTCVLDISEFDTRQNMWRFMADFGEELLRRNREALHLFLDEADEYIPQSTREKGNLPRCLGVWQRVVKRGRFRGIGCTQITQRNAALNLDTLYMAEVLIAMRAVGERDLKAIKGWVSHNNAAGEIVDSLPTLEDGEGWVSSPAWLRETKRVKFRRRRTFDSGATPVLLKKGKRKGATLATVDLDSIRTQMAETIERAKAEDPSELRRRIRQLERDVAQGVGAVSVAEWTAQIDAVRTQLVDERERADRATAALQEVDRELKNIAAAAHGIELSARGVQVDKMPKLEKPAAGIREVQDGIDKARFPAPRVNAPHKGHAPTNPPVPSFGNGVKLPKAERMILSALAQHGELTRVQIAILTGYSHTGGGFGNSLSALRSAGRLDGHGSMSITDKGREDLGHYKPLPEGSDLVDWWNARLSAAEREVLRVLIDHHPDELTREEIAAKTSSPRGEPYAADGGGFGNALSKLRTLELISGRGTMKANERLCP